MDMTNVWGKVAKGLMLAGLLVAMTIGEAKGCYFGEGCDESDESREQEEPRVPQPEQRPRVPNRVPTNPPFTPPQQQMSIASMCGTAMTACPMAPGIALPRGAYCQCHTPMGVFPGQTF